jgi:hypothetical protein
MERIAADVETFHLGVADLDAFLVDPRVEGPDQRLKDVAPAGPFARIGQTSRPEAVARWSVNRDWMPATPAFEELETLVRRAQEARLNSMCRRDHWPLLPNASLIQDPERLLQ